MATTIPCLKPFISALNTNYGAPTHIGTSPSSSKAQYKNKYKLSSLSKGSSLGLGGLAKSQVSAPKTPWDLTNQASVIPGDQHSMDSHESRQMIISRKNEWQVIREVEGSTP